jgi:molybdate transport system substrate-binding protein
MKKRPGAAVLYFAAALLLSVEIAHSAEIKIISANGIHAVVEDIARKFERATGHKLVLSFATGGATVSRAQAGEAADVIIAPQQGIAALAKNGKVAADSAAAIASTGISVAVRKGATKPDISSPEAFRRALLAAKSITYLNPADGAASGIHFAKVLDRMGIAGEMKEKTLFAPNISAVGTMVAEGKAEIGVLQYQLLFAVAGIEIVGPLPGDLQDSTVFSAAIMGTAQEAEASKTLIAFLRSPQGVEVIKAKGKEPPAR